MKTTIRFSRHGFPRFILPLEKVKELRKKTTNNNHPSITLLLSTYFSMDDTIQFGKKLIKRYFYFALFHYHNPHCPSSHIPHNSSVNRLFVTHTSHLIIIGWATSFFISLDICSDTLFTIYASFGLYALIWNSLFFEAQPLSGFVSRLCWLFWSCLPTYAWWVKVKFCENLNIIEDIIQKSCASSY